jgi:hypothetical protein
LGEGTSRRVRLADLLCLRNAAGRLSASGFRISGGDGNGVETGRALWPGKNRRPQQESGRPGRH